MVIHGLCSWSQSQLWPYTLYSRQGSKLPTAVEKQNHPENPQILSSAVQGSALSQLQFSPTKPTFFLLVEKMYKLLADCFERHLPWVVQ